MSLSFKASPQYLHGKCNLRRDIAGLQSSNPSGSCFRIRKRGLQHRDRCRVFSFQRRKSRVVGKSLKNSVYCKKDKNGLVTHWRMHACP